MSVHEIDPELERLLAEEEEIEQKVRDAQLEPVTQDEIDFAVGDLIETLDDLEAL